MSLTKEQCLEELENSRLFTVSVIDEDGYEEWSDGFEQTTTFDTFEKLIKEHYDNEPLKFEELDNMIRKPIWDNKYKKWVLLQEIIIRFSGIKELELTSMNGSGKLVEFENDRFYRKQVD